MTFPRAAKGSPSPGGEGRGEGEPPTDNCMVTPLGGGALDPPDQANFEALPPKGGTPNLGRWLRSF